MEFDATMTLKLLAIFAHPDDEAMGMGGTLAKDSAEGIYLPRLRFTRRKRLVRLRGNKSRLGPTRSNPHAGVGELRQRIRYARTSLP